MTQSIKRRISRLEHLQSLREKEIGKRYGRLVIKDITIIKSRAHAICICDCGVNHTAKLDKLRIGDTASCGCYSIENRRDRARKNLQGHMRVEQTNLYRLSDTPPSNNRSGHRNVFWKSREKKWAVVCEFKKRRYYLGHFDDLIEAKNIAQRFRDDHFNEIKSKYQPKEEK